LARIKVRWAPFLSKQKIRTRRKQEEEEEKRGENGWASAS
jgi:hypothetical protein